MFNGLMQLFKGSKSSKEYKNPQRPKDKTLDLRASQGVLQNKSSKGSSFKDIRQQYLLDADDVLQAEFSKFLKPKELNHFAQTCKGYSALFNESLSIARLLQHVARGEQNAAEAMVKSNSKLLLQKGTVTDYSGRTFTNITAFQYALWALDTHMWKMLLKYFPHEEKDDVTTPAKQLQELVTEKATYQILNPETKEIEIKREEHFDFSPLKDGLQAYVDNYAAWTNEQRAHHWCTDVGGAQRNVPVHVVNEYCHPNRSFHPTPAFNEDNLPRNLTYYHYTTKVNSNWFPLSSDYGLGFHFGLYRVEEDRCGRWPGWGVGAERPLDLAAITALCHVRTQELEKLKQELLNPKTVAPLQFASQRP